MAAVYERVSVALSESDQALRVIEAVPVRRRHPTVILAALHDLAVAGRAPALAAAYAAADGDAAAGAAIDTLLRMTDSVVAIAVRRRTRTKFPDRPIDSEDTPTGDGAIVVHAAVPVAAAVPGSPRPGGEHVFAVVDLAGVDRVAAIIHHGSMDDVLSTGQALARWIDANGYRSVGYAREVTLEWSADPDQWVTELQQPIYATGG